MCFALCADLRAQDHPEPASFRSAFEAQFPKTKTSAAALEIERLATALGIQMAPFESPEATADERNSEEKNPPTPFVLKPRKERPGPSPELERSLLSAGISEFLNRELGIPDDRIGPPPPQLERFLADNESGIAAIESLLLREPEIHWEVDVTNYPNGPLPSLTGLMRLQRVLAARALAKARGGETDAALRTLDAGWRLNEVLSSRPELISQLIVVAAAKIHVGVLRKLDSPAYGWADHLRSRRFFSAYLTAFQSEVWADRDVQDLTGRAGTYGRILRQVAEELSDRDICSWTADSLKGTWARAIRDQSREEVPVATITMPNLIESVNRWRRLLVDAELTALVLDARAERAASRRHDWPGKLNGIGSGVCPREVWSYRPSEGGSATFAFEGRIAEISAPGFRLPLRFTAGIARAAPRTEEGFLEGADGIRLFYRRIGRGKRAIVLLHGGPGSNMNTVWPDLEPLARADRSIFLYDQRGGGRSQVTKDPSLLTVSHHVRDLEAVRVHFGLERFALIGESWGAGLAVLYAAEHPKQVERLLLIGPMPPTREMLDRRMDDSDERMGFRKRLAEVSRKMPDSPDPIATCNEFFSLYLTQFFVRPEDARRRRGSSCNGPPEGVRNYFVVNKSGFDSLGKFDLRPTLSRLEMPAMVIEGERSIPSTVESALVFAQSISRATLLLVPDAGHYPQVERPEVFFPSVEKFLR
jgi:proline iminopeptidase